MLKLLIADDEKVIRESLTNCLKWEDIGISVVGCCANGLEALDCIIDESPDIIMTDIKMPVLNGLELISKMQDMDHEIEFIILSGYKEFDFAKKAIELGVRRYLLKPMSENQILDAVLDAVKCCERRRSMKAAMEERTLLQQQLKQHYRQELLYRLFFNWDLQAPSVYTNLEHLYSHEGCYFNAFLTVRELDAACQLVRAISRRFATQELTLVTDFFYVKDTLFAILHGKRENPIEAFERIIALNSPSIAVKTYAEPSISCCTQRIHQELSLCSRVYTVDETGHANELNSAKLSLKAMQQLPNELLALIKDGAKGKREDQEEIDLVQKVKNYVWCNLDDSSLSLKQIAAQYAHTNADYLSRLFVQKTGEKFSCYLNRKRVEKAKQLLLKDSNKICQIAEQIGLGHNPGYFGQVFKKYTGITPSAYVDLQKNR